MRHKQTIGCLGCLTTILSLGLLWFFVPVLVSALITEYKAQRRSVQVRVVDVDTKQPIAGANVTFSAAYRSFYKGIAHARQSNSRAYYHRTDADGVASIPMKYFLTKDLQYENRCLRLVICNIRIRDLPTRILMDAKHENYSHDYVTAAQGKGDYVVLADKDLLLEIQLRKLGTINTTHGTLAEPRIDHDLVTDYYYRVDTATQSLVTADDNANSDFVIRYKQVDYEARNQYRHKVFTSNSDKPKVLWSIESLGAGGVAVDSNAPFRLEDVSQTSRLDFQPMLLFDNRSDSDPRHSVVVIKLRDGKRFAAARIGPGHIEWAYAGGQSSFRHGVVDNDKSLPFRCVVTARAFDPSVPPDYSRWNARKKKQKKKQKNDITVREFMREFDKFSKRQTQRKAEQRKRNEAMREALERVKEE